MRTIILLAMLAFLLMNVTTVRGQRKKIETTITDPLAKPPAGVLIDINYGMHLPFADMAENFKFNFSLGGKVQYMMPNNLMFGLIGEYQFSEDVRQDVVSNLREPGGSLIDKFGTYSDVSLGQRGFFAGATIGYLIPVLKKTKRSGIEVRFSGGYQQHWVRIEVIGSEVFALTGDYKKGYDRMTSGFAMSQYIGYRHLDKGGLLNFFGGFEIQEGFTKNRRGYNFDTGETDTKNRIDILVGFRIGLAIPFYLYSTETEREVRYY